MLRTNKANGKHITRRGLIERIKRHLGYVYNEVDELLFIGPAVYSKHYRKTLADKDELKSIVKKMDAQSSAKG